MTQISYNEFYLMRDILYELYNFSEKDLLGLVYKTKPVRTLGVKLGQAVKARGPLLLN